MPSANAPNNTNNNNNRTTKPPLPRTASPTKLRSSPTVTPITVSKEPPTPPSPSSPISRFRSSSPHRSAPPTSSVNSTRNTSAFSPVISATGAAAIANKMKAAAKPSGPSWGVAASKSATLQNNQDSNRRKVSSPARARAGTTTTSSFAERRVSDTAPRAKETSGAAALARTRASLRDEPSRQSRASLSSGDSKPEGFARQSSVGSSSPGKAPKHLLRQKIEAAKGGSTTSLLAVAPVVAAVLDEPAEYKGIVVCARTAGNIIGEVIVTRHTTVAELTEMIRLELGQSAGFGLRKNQIPITTQQYGRCALEFFRSEEDRAIITPAEGKKAKPV